MRQLEEFLATLKSQILALLARIEDSPQFEKLLMSYEALDPRHQSRIHAGSKIIGAILLITALITPIFSVLSAKGINRDYYNVIAEMQAFNSANNVIFQPAPRPLGWTPLPTASLEDLEGSFVQFLANNGVPQDFMDIQKSGQGLRVKVEQISIRQAVYFVFQLDGWNPALRFQNLKISVNKESSNLLDLEADLDFDAEAAGKLSESLGNLPSNDMGYRSATSPQMDTGIPTDSGSNSSPDTDYPPPPPPSDDFGADLPPPPPFEEDL